MEHILELNNFLCRRDDFQLGPLNWALPVGQFCCLVGPNGSGKSTLLQAIMGLIKNETGSWSIAGSDVQPRQAAWKESIGFAFDGQVLHDRLSVQANLELHAKLRKSWDHDLAKQLIESFKIDPAKMVANLSRGQKQALGTILAMAHRPHFLLLDEVTNGMDTVVRKAWNEAVFQLLGEGGMTVLMATHVMSDVANLADRIAFIRDGRIIKDAEKDSLIESWRQISCRAAPAISPLPNTHRWESRGETLRFISENAAADLALLKAEHASHIESNPMNLGEICSYILEKHSDA